jgi:hypothetical protein
VFVYGGATKLIITTFSLTSLSITIKKCDTQHKDQKSFAKCRFCCVQFLYCHAECHYAECHYAECRYAECQYAEFNYAECPVFYIVMPSVTLLSIVMQSVIKLNVIMPSVMAPIIQTFLLRPHLNGLDRLKFHLSCCSTWASLENIRLIACTIKLFTAVIFSIS